MSGSGVHSDFGFDATRTIISFGILGEAAYCAPYAQLYINCTDIFSNQGGDYTGCLSEEEGINGNFSADPLFCDGENGDYTLHEDSPCLPGNHPDGYECDLIGAWPEGCPTTSVSEHSYARPGSLLRSLSPNPFSLASQITYEIPSQAGIGRIQLDLYDSAGRLVHTLVDRVQPAGVHIATWDGRNRHGEEVAAGVYLCRLRLDGRGFAKRLVHIR
jgi:hypothetical protein